MRLDSELFTGANESPNRETRVVCEIEYTETDKQYIGSHSDCATPDGVIRPDEYYTYKQTQIITDAAPANQDYLGGSVSFSSDGTKLLTVAAAFDNVTDHRIAKVNVHNANGNKTTFTLDEALLAADTTIDDHFGLSAYISGDGSTVAIGAPKEATTASDAGAFYIFQASGGTWVERQRIEFTGIAAADQFGWKIGLSYDGKVVLCTAPFADSGGTDRGKAFIFQTTSSTWASYTETELLQSDPVNSDNYGYGATLSGDGNCAFIASNDTGNSGKVYAFYRSANNQGWPTAEDQQLIPADSDAGDFFGAARSASPTLFSGSSIVCSFNGERLFVGSRTWVNSGGVATGCVYFYQKSDVNWLQKQTIEPEDYEGTSIWFSYKLDCTNDGLRLIVGAQSDNVGALTSAGAAFLFDLNDSVYTQTSRILPTTSTASEFFGFSAAIDGGGKMVAVGATDYTDTATDQGSVRLFDVTASIAYLDTLRKISGVTQKYQPLRAISSIGNLSFDVVNTNSNISDMLFRRISKGIGTRERLVRAYIGNKGLSWADYSLIQTVHIQNIEFKNGAYNFKCEDIQRTIKRDIFDLKQTNLESTISATDETITVVRTDGFVMKAHDSNYTDAPSQTVGYIKIDDEVIRYTGLTKTTYTGCFRGALGTKAVEHAVDAGVRSDRKPEVDEFVYFETVALKIVYQLLTGVMPGQEPEILSPTQNIGIDTTFVNLTQFTQYPDLWDGADGGFVVRFEGTKKTDAKKFIYKELLLLTGCVMPILADGRIGLKRMASVLTDAPYVGVLNNDNVISYSSLTLDNKSVANRFVIQWNWSEIKEKFTRINTLIDVASRSIHRQADTITLKFRAMHGSRHTLSTLARILDFIRDRFSGPPELITLHCLSSANKYEAGDVLLVVLDNVIDSNGGTSISKSMEVLERQIDWRTGNPKLKMFGSTLKAAPQTFLEDTSVLPDSYYDTIVPAKTGSTDISANGALTTNLVGAVLHITAGNFVGNDSTANGAAWHYYSGNIQVDAGSTITTTKNIVICCKGHVQIDGILNAKGAGISATANGVAGYIGNSEAGGGFNVTSTPSKGTTFINYTSNGNKPVLQGKHVGFEPINIKYDGNDILNIPDTMEGTAGASGSNITADVDDGSYQFTGTKTGGAGGDSGGSITFICKSISFGIGGKLDISGNSGAIGQKLTLKNLNFYAGTGGGGTPGAVLVLLDGSHAFESGLDKSLTANYGSVPQIGHRLSDARTYQDFVNGHDTYRSHFQGRQFNAAPQSHYLVKYIQPNLTPELDTDDPTTVLAPSSFTAQSDESYLLISNDGTHQPRIYLTWTPDTTELLITHYEVQFKKSTESLWGPAQQIIGRLTANAHIIAITQGETYDVRIRAVNTFESVFYYSDYSTITNHTVIGKSTAPIDVATFQISAQSDGTREFTWTYTPPVDLAGFIIKYVSGSGGVWSGMSEFPGAEELPKGLRKFESNQLSSGTYTFGIKAVDTAGNESANATIIEASLPDRRLASNFAIINLLGLSWPGAKTQCSIDCDGSLYASNQDTFADAGSFGAMGAWNTNPFLSMTYEHSVVDLGAVVTYLPVVNVAHNGGTITIQESHSDDDISYSSFTDVGPSVTSRYSKVKITITRVSGISKINYAEIFYSGTPQTEIIPDLDTSTIATNAGDFRAPVVNTYSLVKRALITLQSVGSGWSYEVIDKGNIDVDGLRWLASTAYSVGNQIYPDANDNGHYYECTTAGTSGGTEPASWPTSGTQVDNTVTWTEYGLQGPRIKLYNSSDTLADATVDVDISGI